MPTIVQTTLGKVTGLWGSAVLLMGNGKVVALKIGDLVHKGDVVLTTQDGIVQLTDTEGAGVEVIADTKPRQTPDGASGDIDRVIAELNTGNGDSAPAAGLVGGDGAGLTPGYRVDRIAEGVGPNAYGQSAAAERTPLSQYVATQTASTSDAAPAVPRDPATTVTLGVSAPTVTEGGSVVYTATVGAPVTGAPLVIGLSNGQTITIPVGQTTGSSAPFVPRADDVQVQGPQNLDVTVSTAAGGNYQSVAPTGPASVQVVDDVDTTHATLSVSSASVAEGGSLVYTVTLDNAVAGSPLVISLSNGQTITIPVGASSGSAPAFAVRGDDAHAQGTQTLNVGISGSSGGSFEGLDTSSTISATVTDDADVTTIAITASTGTVAEGGSVVYTATVNGTVQGSPLVIQLSNGQSITIPVGASSASAPAFAVRADDAYVQGNQTLNVGVTSSSGGDFEALASSSASTVVTDDADATTVTLSVSSAAVTEGGSLVYTAAVGAPVTGSPLVLTLSNGQTITIPVGASSATSAAFAVRADDVRVQGTETLSVSITHTSGGNYETVTPTGTAVTTVSDDADATTLALSASASTVSEGGSIVYTATLSNAVQGTPLTITLDNGAIITIPVGASSASSNPVAVRADDAQQQAPETVTVAVGSTSGGDFEAITPTGPVSTTVIDNPTGSAITLSASATSVAEGGAVIYTATVDHPVAGSALTITLSNGEVITIPVGQSTGSSAPVVLRADDAYAQAAQPVTTGIVGTAGGNYESLAATSNVTVTVSDDNDATTVTLNASPNADEGGSILYVATLTSPAATPVTVTLSNGQTITIAAGDVWGYIAVPAPSEDVYAETSSVSATITGATGGGFENLQVNPAAAVTIIDDTVDTTTLSITGSASVAEGASASYTLSLTSPAQTAVTVTLTYSGTAANGADFTGVTTVTIPAGASSAGFSIATLDDTLAEGAENFTVTIGGTSGGNFENLLVSSSNGSITTGIVDNDVASVSLSATPSVSEAGGSIVYTATVTQAPTAPLTVTLSNGATITVAAGALTGSTSVPFAASDDVYSETASTSATISSTSGGGIPLGIDPAPAVTTITDTIDTTTVTLTATPSVNEGGQITYTVSLTSPAQGPVTVVLDDGTVIGVANGATSGSVSVPAPADDVYVDAGVVTRGISTATGGNFEHLAINPAPASTSVTDTADTTTVSLSATPSVAEGGNVTYTASLTAVAQSNVSVSLDNGQVITILAGQTSGSISIPAPTDDVYVDAASIAARISGATGGGFEHLAVNSALAVTSVTDTPDTTTVTLSGTPSVAEGGQITYVASLSAPAQTAVTVNLSNGQAITIAAGAASGSITLPAPANDTHVGNSQGSVSVNITSASGGNFESLVASPAPVTTTVTDTVDTTTLSLSATPSVAEGGQITYTASLTSAAQTDVTVTLNDGTVITILAGTSSGSVTLPAPADDVYVDASTVTRNIATATGGNFESLSVDATPASTSVTDTLNTTTVSLSATPTVAEGGNVTYTASLTAVAQSNVTVTLDNGQSITILAGQSSGSISIPAPADDVYVDAASIAARISGATGGGFEQLAVNSAPAVTSVTDTPDTTTVTLTATPSVSEGGQITYTASLSSVAQSAVTVTLDNGTVITILAGASSGSINVPAPADDVYADGSTITRSIDTATGGNFENLVASPATASTTVADTLDTTTVTLSATPTVTEGGSIVYTATLSAAAGTPVTITLSNNAQITIAAGATTGTVTVAAPADTVYVDAQNVSATISTATGGGFEDLQADPAAAVTAVTDDTDTSTVTLTATPSVAEGGQIVYTAALTSPAQSPVTVTLNDGTQIVIAAGSSSNTVSLPAPADDVYADGSTVSRNIATATGGNFEQLAVDSTPASTTVTDTVNTTTVSLTGSASVAEGASASYTVSLTSPALSAVTISLNYSGTAANGTDFTGIATVTIPAGASSADFSIATLDDSIAEGSESFQVAITGATGGGFEQLAIGAGSVTTGIVDNDISTVSLSATGSLSEAGGSITYTATLTQAPIAPMTVTLSNGAVIGIAAGAFSGTVSVPVAASDDVYVDPTTISATISSTSGGGIPLAIDPSPATTNIVDTLDPTTVTLTASAASVAEGGAVVYTASVDHAVTGSALVLTLSNGQTITIPVGQTSASSAPSVLRADDAYTQGTQTVNVGVSSHSGGNFEAVVATSTTSTTVSDDVDTTTVTLSASTASVAEGGSITYTATVNNAVTGSPLVITLSNGQTITIPVGQSSASSAAFAVRADDAYAQGTQTLNVTVSNTTGGNYENLATAGTATTTVTDDADNTSVTLSASSASVAEGGSITYTATVSNPVQGAPFVVTLSNGQTITIPVGQSSASSTPFAVRADDAYAQGNTTVSASISGTSGGNFESVSTGPAASTTVTDDGDATTVTLTASSANVTEGGSITYTATLSNPVGGSTPMTITLSNGQTITIAVGASSGSSTPFAVRGDDAYVQADDTLTVSVSGTSGGNFEAVTATGSATTVVTDDADASVVTLSASASTVAEGGSITYTASVSNPVTGSDLVITLNNGQVITIPVGASSASSAAVPVRADDAYVQPNGTVTASISGTTGGRFESLTTSSTASTTVVDDSDATTVTLSASSANVTEGGSITYTATLSNAVTGSPMTITLSNGQTITIPVGQSSGTSAAFAVRGDDAYVQANDTLTVSVSSTSGGNFEAVSATGSATTVVRDDSDSTVVTLSASATSVNEGGSITYTATVSNAVTGSPLVITMDNGRQITIPVGQSSGTSAAVPVRADDAYVQPNGTVTASITGTTGGNYEALTTTSTATTTVTDDGDATTVTLSASATTVAEGGSIVYTATVNNAVTGSPLVVTLSNGQQITIPVGQSSASSAAFAVRTDDAYVQGNATVGASITGTTGGNFEAIATGPAVSTTVTDDADATTVTLSASSASVAEGGSITYTATVNNAVTGTPLVITLNNGQVITIPVGQSSASSAAVPVRADDAHAQGNQTVTASITNTSGGNFEALTTTSTASTVVTDDGDATSITLSASAASVTEGGSIVYTATVANAVQGSALVISLSNGQSITIPVGQTSASSAAFAVRGDDVYTQGTQTLTVSIDGTTGGNFEAVDTASTATTTVTDDADVTTVTLTASSATVNEGGSIVYTATVNNAVQGSALVITLNNGQTITIPVGSSSASSAAVPVRADDAYVQPNGTVTASINSTSGGNFEALDTASTASTTVTDDGDATLVTLTASSASVTEGGSITYTATVSNPVTGSALVVTLSNGQTITIPVGASSASSAAFAVRGDDAYLQGNTTVSASITGTTGGNYEAVTAGPAVSTMVTDDSDATVVTLSASATSVNEGGAIVYTATVSNAVTGSPLVITLNNGQQITIPVGASSGTSAAVPVRADDAYVQPNGTVTASISGTSGGNFEALTTTSTATTTVTDDGDSTLVTLTASATSVAEGGSIIYTATVSNPVTGAALVVTLSNGQTITIPVGASNANSAAFAVRADDAYVQGNATVSASITGTTGGNYEAVAAGPAVSTTVTDDSDATTVTLTASSANVTEGGSITYTATLSNPVGGSTPMTITLSNGQTITIPVGQSSGTSAAFAVRADDAYVQANDTLSVTISNTSGGNFEAVTPTGTATTTVRDDADSTVVTLSASSNTVNEGGSIVYTATVNNAVTGTPLVITLSNGQTITIPVGASSASSAAFAVRGDDAYVQGNTTVSASISGTTGGSYEAVAAGPAVSTTVTDDADATTVTLTASSANVTEGGSITYTATVNNAVTGTPLVVTLSNGQTITIPVGQSSASSAAFAVRADDAYVQGNQTVTTSISGTTGGNYEAVAAGPAASTTVTDDADATTVTLTASSSTVNEGGSITYTATLNNAVTGSPLTITLSNGQTITIPVGQSSGTSAAFAVRGDDAYVQGTQTLNVTVGGTSGGNFEAVTATGTATTTVTDDGDSSVVTLSASATTVAEGGSIIYTASVSNPVTGSALVLTLSNGQTITIPVGASSASSAAFAVRGDDAYVQGAQTLNVGISSRSGGNYEALTTSSTVSTTVTDDSDATTVTLTASSASVTEGGSIVYTATVNNAVTGTPLLVTLSNGQTITIPVGSSSASSAAFAVRGDDAYAQGNTTVSASITGTTGGNYEAVATGPAVSTTVTDDADPTTVTLSVSSPTVIEGGSVTYTATLSNAVTGAPLVINLSNGQTITIPVGSSSGTSAGYVVRADDAYAQGSQAVSVGVSSTSGGNYEALTTTSTASTTVSDDSDTTTVSLSGATSVTEGGNAVYTLTLSSPAATAVTVTLTYGGTAANGTDYTAVTTVTIPAGASSANFTVPTTNDTLSEANETIAISIGGVSGGGFEAIAAHPSNNAVTTTITDNDPLPTIAINDVVVNEAAGTATFTVTLSAASGQQVTVGYGTGNGTATAGSDYTASSGTLTFAPGVTSQTITVSILNDGTYEGVENFNVNLSTPTNATIADNQGVGTIRDDGTGAGGTDNDTPTLAVSSPTVAEGGGFAVFTVSLSNAASSATTVSLATVAGTATAGTDYSTTLQVSTDGGANWTNASSATFAAGATSVLVRSAITNDTLDELNESFTLTATTTAGATTNSSASGVATITDDDPTPTLAINDVSVNEAAGTMTFTVTLSTASGQQVTVDYGTSNGTATAGSDYTATSGTLTFAPGVTSQTITVSIVNDTTTESTETFNVNLSGATNATIADNLGVGSIVDNDARPVIDLDANNSSAGGVDYTATFTENGSPVSIADTDISMTDVDSSALTGATITLTNAQAGDVLAAGTMPSGITASLVGNVITLSGSASLAAYQTAIRAITFSNTSDTPSTADRIITVTVSDGTSSSATATTYMHVVAVNDAPVATGGSVTGTEDTALVLSWSTFGVTDVDSATTSLGIRISTLPADGTLQTWNGSAWTNVATGQTISKASIDSGFFRLVPDANESGSDAYAGTAVGNRQSDYARFNFTPTDGSADGAVATVRIDITPVTDAPTLTHNASTQVTGTLTTMTSIGLSRDYYQDVPTLTSGASSSAPNTGEIGIETAVPTSSSTITNVGVAGNVGDTGVQVAEDDAYRIQGLIYLEAGKTYVFSGYADDTSRLEIGGTTLMSGQWGGSGQASNGTFTATSFTPTATGYYSLEFMVYNTSGPGSYDLNVSVNGATAVDVSTANFYLYQSITQVDSAGAQRGAFVPNTTTGEGGYYPVTYDAGVQSKVYLAPIVASLSDTDGSETLAIQLQNIAVGATISDGTRSFTATAGTTSVVVTNWDLSRLSVTMPSGFSGTANITAVATATETATGATSATTLNIPFTIDLDGALAKQSEANTYNADALIGLAGNDSFTVTETGNGLSVAVSQGSSSGIQALTGTETTATTNQVFSTGGGNDLVQSGAGDDTIYLGDSGNSNHPSTGAAPTTTNIAATRLMTLADGSLTNADGTLTSTADNTSSNSNTAINTWADVANAGSGNDVVYGQGGTDLIYGGSGNDYLNGGAGNDGLRGGSGNDILVGGAGNDVLRGDAGADVFRWEFGDKGTAGTPAADIIMDFDTATPNNGGDVLDLRDLLQGEAANNLGNYLHFSVSGGNTVIQISSTGAFSTGFANNKIDQTITLQNVDLTNSGSLTTDQQIINDLMNKSKLLVDGS